MKVVWGDRAKKSFSEIRKYIRLKFTEKEDAVFVQNVFNTISSIQQFPKAFPKSELKELKSTRKAVVHPHSTIFYRIEKDTIRLLLFWDNRKDPKKRR